MYFYGFPTDPNPTIEKWIIVRLLGRFSSFVQKWAGLDCFFFAGVFAIIALISNSVVIYLRIQIIAQGYMPMPGDGLFLAFLWCSIRLFAPKHPLLTNSIAFKKFIAYSMVAQGLKNIELFRLRYSYYIVLMVTGLAFVFTIFHPIIQDISALSLLKAAIPLITYWLAMAFCACSPEQPRKSKLREGLEKLKEKLSEVTIPGVGEPEPNPV